MFAGLAALAFAVGLIQLWVKQTVGDIFTPQTMLYFGLIFIALHLLFDVAMPYVTRTHRQPPPA